MPKILIVDDEPSIVDNISFALETEGFSVIYAQQEAIRSPNLKLLTIQRN